VLRLQRGAHTVTAKWVALAAATSMVVACASSAMQAQSGAAPEPRQQTGAPAGSPHDQIEALSQQIDQQRVELKLPAPSAMTPMAAGSNVTATCVRSPSAVCSQTCQLSDSICDNAKKICDIAKQLPADDWAAKKCSEGNETCSAAKAQCCECSS